MQVEFLADQGEVSGSCHLVTVGERRILLDCGLLIGDPEDDRRNAEPFGFDPHKLDALILSNAHLDQVGRLPVLIQQGYRGPIYAQAATAELAQIMLEDAAAMAEADIVRDNLLRMQRGERPAKPLYSRKDIAACFAQIQPIAYDQEVEIARGVRLRLRDAGHILGSSTVELWGEEGSAIRKLVYSSDIGARGTPILRDPQPIDDADAVLLKSAYGNRQHCSRNDTVKQLADVFATARRNGGNVVIPAFAVGRVQELLYWLAVFYIEWHIGEFALYLDSPLASHALAAYRRHEELYDDEAARSWSGRSDRLKLPNLFLAESVADSQSINSRDGGSIIIAGAAMCNAGRIRHHLRQNLPRRSAQIVFMGHQAQGTLGRTLVDGELKVRMFDEWIQVHAERHSIEGLSANADQAGLIEWYAQLQNRPKVYLVHGEEMAREALAETLRDRFHCHVEMGMPGMHVQV